MQFNTCCFELICINGGGIFDQCMDSVPTSIMKNLRSYWKTVGWQALVLNRLWTTDLLSTVTILQNITYRRSKVNMHFMQVMVFGWHLLFSSYINKLYSYTITTFAEDKLVTIVANVKYRWFQMSKKTNSPSNIRRKENINHCN